MKTRWKQFIAAEISVKNKILFHLLFNFLARLVLAEMNDFFIFFFHKCQNTLKCRDSTLICELLMQHLTVVCRVIKYSVFCSQYFFLCNRKYICTSYFIRPRTKHSDYIQSFLDSLLYFQIMPWEWVKHGKLRLQWQSVFRYHSIFRKYQ